MKAVAEIFKLASRINIKPKDIIGVGGDIVKMGKSLFNTKVNPELTKFINKKGEIPTKIVEDIKIHLRSLKNASENQVELFKINLKDIVNAKFPPKADVIKLPVSSSKKLLPSDKESATGVLAAIPGKKSYSYIDAKGQKRIMPTKGWMEAAKAAAKGEASLGTKEYYLNTLKNTYPKHYNRLSGKETTAELKEIVYRLDTEGVPFESGGMAKLNAELNQLPEYYLPFADGGIANHFRKK